MKNTIAIVLLWFVASSMGHAQPYYWIPTNSPLNGGRFEDVYFLDDNTGYAVNYYAPPIPGYVAKTTDGGNNWTKVFDSTNFGFRDIAFTDEMHGFTGTLLQNNVGADTNIMYKTVDGGNNWMPVTNLPGPATAGICGLRTINDSTLYGVGRYFGPAGFYKTTNNGQSWTYTNLDSLALGLVDAWFFNQDTGFVAGVSGSSINNGVGRVLYTTNGGDSWSVVFTAAHSPSIGWKFSFPSRMIGYCSLDFFNTPAMQYFLKTTDGGLTWQEILYINGPGSGYHVEGMGFLNDSVGWVGGGTNVYFTQNGGTTWMPETWGNNVNRFRFLSDSLGYAAGEKVYRMQLTPLGVTVTVVSDAMAVYPNPTMDKLWFAFSLEQSAQVNLSVYDLKGNLVEEVFKGWLEAGEQEISREFLHLPAGLYLAKLSYGEEVVQKRVEVLR